MHIKIIIYVLGMGVFGLVASHAQKQADLIVSATGIATPINQTGVAVSLITAADLQRRQTPYLIDTLKQYGIHVPQSGGVGALSNVFLRGLPGRYTNLISDGISMFDSTANQVQWQDVITDGIGRVEILRGSHGVLYGSSSVAGVVVQETAIGGERAAQARFEIGSFATRRLNFSGKGQAGKTAYGYSVGQIDSNSISAADAKNGNSESDAYTNNNARWRSDTKLNDAWALELAAYVTSGQLDYDEGFPVRDSNHHNRFSRYGVRVGARYVADASRHRFNAQRYSDERTDITNFSPGTIKSNTSVVKYDGDARVHEAVRLIWGGEFKTDKFEHSASNPDGHDVSTQAVYLLAHITPHRQWALTTAWRRDVHDLFGGQNTWRAAAAFTPTPIITWRALYGTGYRAPHLSELFGFGANPDLQPEYATTQELGLDIRASAAVDIALTIFDIKIDDLIGYHPISFRNRQISGVTHSKGVESQIEGVWQDWLARLAITYSDSRQPHSDGRLGSHRSARVPRWQYNLSLDHEPFASFSYGVSLNYVHDTVDFGNVPLENYWLAGVRASYALARDAEIYGRIDNLLDEDYQTIVGYGTAGRAAYVGLKIKF